jgi:TRAP-type mannitol/chloroaromatic compound transport system permease small subunit
MRYLLALADAIDWATEYLGQWLKWLVLFSSLVSAFNALMRYTIHYSSNAWLEIQWYMFGAMFLLAAGYALKHEEHVRVDVFFSRMTPKQQAWLDVFGGIFFLMPMALIIAWMSIPMVVNSIHIMEHSSDPGGLIRWPIKIIIPIGFLLLAIQGVAEIIKKFAVATGIREPGRAYERPVQ